MPRRSTDLDVRTMEKIDEVITALALSNGHIERARRRLRENGLPTNTRTVERIRDANVGAYQDRRRELAPQIEDQLAADLLDNATEATEAAKLLVAETRRQLDAGTIDDPARAARELSQVATQAIDKRLAIMGRPTAIVENRNYAEILRALAAKGIVEVIDASAIEEPNRKDEHDRRAAPAD